MSETGNLTKTGGLTETGDLIETLVRNASPVRPLASPWRRSAAWLGGAAAGMAGVALVFGLCPNLMTCLGQPLYDAWLAAAGLTGIGATIGAFMRAQPDRPRAWAWLPVPAALAWIGTVAARCVTASVSGDLPLPGDTARCLGILLLAAGGLALPMWAMLGRAPLGWTRGPLWLACIAVASLATAALSLARTFQEPGPVLVWNLGAAAAIALGLALASRLGRVGLWAAIAKA